MITLLESEFDELFPFYILINDKMQIVSLGISMQKLGTACQGSAFTDYFSVEDPSNLAVSFDALTGISDHAIRLLMTGTTKIVFNGQFKYLHQQNYLLFIGAPFFDGNTEMLALREQQHIEHEYIHELHSIISQQKEELRRVKLVADARNHGVVFSDRMGRVTWINTGFSDLTGHTFADAIDKSLFDLCHSEYSPGELINHLKHQYRKGSPFEIEIPLQRTNASSFWAIIKGQPITGEDGVVNEYLTIVEDITADKENKERLQQQENKYQGIIANMNLGTVEINKEGKIRYVNQSFCKMSGYKHHELVGQDIDKLFVHEDFRVLVEERRHLRQKGKSDAYELQVRIRNGEPRWWLISAEPLFDSQGEFAGSIGIHLDITGHKLLHQQLEAARKEAEHSSRAKDLFLANMSHEIRTPMNAILGMSRQLQKTSLTPQQQHFLSIMGTAAENLLVIINDILDFSKIEAGKITLEDIGFNIQDLMHNTVQLLQDKAEEKGISLSLSVDENAAPVLIGDPYRINQVVTNLVSNAIKFTKQGSVELSCQVIGAEELYQEIEISVTDTGKGMDTDFLQNLFNKFSQEDESIARSYGGTGLGMSIVKQLVELMHGSISVKSKKGKGTQVTIHLTFVKGHTDDLPKKDDSSFDAHILAGKTILLVEDNELNRWVAISILEQYGAAVVEAANGEAAIAMLERNPMDLVLMDMQMPVMDGITATKIIRANLNTSIPIIALTANVIKGEMEKCLQAGMNDYIGKPFEEEDLIRIIAKWLGKEIVAPSKALPKDQSLTDAPLYDLEILKKIGRGNEAYVRKMVDIFQRETTLAIQEMESGFVAQDIEKIKFYAHRIKPSLKNLNMAPAKQIAEAIEHGDWESTRHKELIDLFNQFKKIVNTVTVLLGQQYSNAG